MVFQCSEAEVKHMEVSNPSAEYQEELARRGEEIEALEKSYGIWQSVKMHRMALVYTLAAYSCAAVYGYDTIANGATIAIPAFDLYFGHYDAVLKELYLDSIWTSLWSSMTNVGSILGSAIAGPISQLVGRRYTGIGFGAITIVGVAVQYVSTSKGELLAGKIINGIAVGGLLAVGTTYASEISPPRLRGILLGGLAFFVVAMQTVGLGVVRAFVPDTRPMAFRTAFAIQWLVGVLPVIGFLLSPESPNFLLFKGRIEEARKAMCRLHGKDNNVDAHLARLRSAIQREEQAKSSNATYLDCFKGTDLKRTLTVCLLWFGNGLIGTAFLTQNIYFLMLAGLPVIHAFDINTGGFGLALLIMPLMWLFGDNFGRRPLYLVGVVGNVVVLAIVGGLGCVASSHTGAIWAIAILVNLLITWQQFTNSLVTWSMSPELSSYKLRQHSQSISIMTQAFTSWLFAFVTPYMYNVGAGSGNLGAKTAFVYMSSSILLLLVAFFWIPETKGLTTEELDWLYEKGVAPRKFAGMRVQGEAVVGRKTGVGEERPGEVGTEVEVGHGKEEEGEEGRQCNEKTVS